MTSNENLEKLQAAYKGWADSKGKDPDCWLNILSDTVCLRTMGEESPGLAFAEDRFSKEEVAGYLTGLAENWDMIQWTPQTFVSDGDTIAMFGQCSWANKATRKIAACRIAHLCKFKDGEIVEFTEVFDSARAAAAATP